MPVSTFGGLGVGSGGDSYESSRSSPRKRKNKVDETISITVPKILKDAAKKAEIPDIGERIAQNRLHIEHVRYLIKADPQLFEKLDEYIRADGPHKRAVIAFARCCVGREEKIKALLNKSGREQFDEFCQNVPERQEDYSDATEIQEGYFDATEIIDPKNALRQMKTLGDKFDFVTRMETIEADDPALIFLERSFEEVIESMTHWKPQDFKNFVSDNGEIFKNVLSLVDKRDQLGGICLKFLRHYQKSLGKESRVDLNKLFKDLVNKPFPPKRPIMQYADAKTISEKIGFAANNLELVNVNMLKNDLKSLTEDIKGATAQELSSFIFNNNVNFTHIKKLCENKELMEVLLLFLGACKNHKDSILDIYLLTEKNEESFKEVIEKIPQEVVNESREILREKLQQAADRENIEKKFLTAIEPLKKTCRKKTKNAYWK